MAHFRFRTVHLASAVEANLESVDVVDVSLVLSSVIVAEFVVDVTIGLHESVMYSRSSIFGFQMRLT